MVANSPRPSGATTAGARAPLPMCFIVDFAIFLSLASGGKPYAEKGRTADMPELWAGLDVPIVLSFFKSNSGMDY